MPFEAWTQGIRTAQAHMDAGDLTKVVLARVAEIRFDGRVNIDAALDKLAAAYPETYRFLFEARPGHAFFGATPELLAKVDGQRVTTMGLAGSIRRGETPDDDARLAADLLASAKDRHEHQIVVDRMRQRLEPVSEALEIGETGIMRLSNIQHLHTPISGTLRRGEGVLPVVAALHPTPALGGEPRETALRLIDELEPVPRGWYAAPVGWIDRQMDGEFGVAIRSAVVQDQRAWLYAGAGIVRESDPQKEWDETQLKFAPMLHALGANQHVS
jgi:menaquinone-specific isochorismate synthase